MGLSKCADWSVSVLFACSKVESSREEAKTFTNGYASSEGLVKCLNANIWGHFDIYEHDIFHANSVVVYVKVKIYNEGARGVSDRVAF